MIDALFRSRRFSSRHRKRPHFFSFNKEAEPGVAEPGIAGEGGRHNSAAEDSSINRTLEFDESPVAQLQAKTLDTDERRPSLQQQVTLSERGVQK